MSRDEIERLENKIDHMENKIDNIENNLSLKIDDMKEKYFAMYGQLTVYIEKQKNETLFKRLKLEKLVFPTLIVVITISITKFAEYLPKIFSYVIK